MNASPPPLVGRRRAALRRRRPHARTHLQNNPPPPTPPPPPYRYLLSLEPDRLLWAFRANAGLPTPGQPYGGWEDPGCEVRGQFLGHWLTAMSMLYRSNGEFLSEESAFDARVFVSGCFFLALERDATPTLDQKKRQRDRAGAPAVRRRRAR